jgi:hypothetical protein
MYKRLILFTIIFVVIHFSFSIISIFNGFVIFNGPSTTSENIWSEIMNILLFPMNVILSNVNTSNQLLQTLLILINSFIWGIVFGMIYYWLTKHKNKQVLEK